MNLHQMVSGVTGAINPFIPVVVSVSSGYTTGANGKQLSSYTTTNTTGQVQALTAKDLHIAGISLESNVNQQKVQQKIYLNGNFEGVFRVLGKGGDLISFNGETYLVVAVLERWPDWCSLAITMQVN